VALPDAGARSFRHVMKRPRPARTSAMIQIQDRCERGGVLGGSSGVRVSDGKVVAVRRADEAAAESSAGFGCSKVGELFAMRFRAAEHRYIGGPFECTTRPGLLSRTENSKTKAKRDASGNALFAPPSREAGSDSADSGR